MPGPLAGMRLSVTDGGPGTLEAAALLLALGASPDTGDSPLGGADAQLVLRPPSRSRGHRESARTTIAQRTGLAAAAWQASRLRMPDGVVDSLLGAWLAVDALARAIAERRGLPAPLLAPADELVLASIGPSLADAAAGRASRALGEGLTPPIVVECSDGAVFVGVASDEDWQVLAGVVGDARLADPIFVTASGRRSHRAEAAEVLGGWARKRSRSEVVSQFTDLRLPVAPTWTLTDATADPPIGSRFTPTLPFELDADASSGAPLTPGSSRGAGAGRSDAARRLSAAGPLTGHVVLDISSLVAGPLAGRILADLGATVLKIEAPGRPDGTRGSGEGPRSTFELLNRGKDALTLDLREASGRRQLEGLLAIADLGMDSFSPRVLPSLGMPVPRLLASGAAPAWLSITGYGLDGEYRDRVALDATASCVSGLVKGAVLRGANCSTQPFGWPVVDTLTGLHASVAATALLLARSIGRPSSWMGCALVDSGLFLARRLEETDWRSSAGGLSAASCSVTDIAPQAVRASPWRT